MLIQLRLEYRVSKDFIFALVMFKSFSEVNEQKTNGRMKSDSGRIRTFAPRGNLLTAMVHTAGRPRNQLSTLSVIRKHISKGKNNHSLKLPILVKVFREKKDCTNSSSRYINTIVLNLYYVDPNYVHSFLLLTNC